MGIIEIANTAWKWAKKFYWCHVTCILLVVFIILIFVSLLLVWNGTVTDKGHIITMFGYIFTVFAIMHASSQFRATHDWNRRDAAMLVLKNADENTKEDVIVLDRAFNYIRRKMNEPIDTKEIHYKICKVDKNGKLLTDENDGFVIDHDSGGVAVKSAIRNLLNTYEHICVGVMQGTFDETIVYQIEAGNIMSAYFIFEDYIKHLNEKMYPDRDGRIYENLKYIANKFKRAENMSRRTQKEREKTA